jgi:uncharacterized membrane protein HdeD (DUF308 family)
MNEKHLLADFLSSAWWIVLLRGLLAIAFGVSAVAWPGLTLATFVLIFGVFALVDGVFDVVHAIRFRKDLEHWGLELIAGLVGIGFGVLVLIAPLATAAVAGIVIAFYVAAWAIITGVLRIVMAIRLRKEIEGEWLLGLSGVAVLLLGVWIMARPTAGVVAMVSMIGVFAIATGLFLVMLALKVRKVGKGLAKLVTAP